MRSFKQIVFWPLGFFSLMLFVLLHVHIKARIHHWTDTYLAQHFWPRHKLGLYFCIARFLERYDRFNSRRMMHFYIYELLDLFIAENVQAKHFLSSIEVLLNIFPNALKRQRFLDAQRLTYQNLFEQAQQEYRSALDQMELINIASVNLNVGFSSTTTDSSGMRHTLWDSGFEPFFCKALSKGHLEVAQLFAQYELPWSYTNPKTNNYFLPNAFLYLFGPLSYRLDVPYRSDLQALFLQSVFSQKNGSETLSSDQIINAPVHLSPFTLPIVKINTNPSTPFTLRTLFDASGYKEFLDFHAAAHDAQREQQILNTSFKTSPQSQTDAVVLEQQDKRPKRL